MCSSFILWTFSIIFAFAFFLNKLLIRSNKYIQLTKNRTFLSLFVFYLLLEFVKLQTFSLFSFQLFILSFFVVVSKSYSYKSLFLSLFKGWIFRIAFFVISTPKIPCLWPNSSLLFLTSKVKFRWLFSFHITFGFDVFLNSFLFNSSISFCLHEFW